MGMDRAKLKAYNTEALAYMGDAVYEQAVRQRLIEQGHSRVDLLHKMAVRYVNAAAQADVIRAIFDQLDKEEQALVKRARNHRFHSKAKHADPVTYKWATAFEAFAGYLYLAGDHARLEWFMDEAFAHVEREMSDER